MRFGKIISAFLGVVLLIAGLGLTVAGGIALTLPDDDGWVEVGPARISSDAAAIVGDDLRIDFGEEVTGGGAFVAWDAFPARVETASRNGKAVFVGIGPAGDVRRYLDGAAVAAIVDLDGDPAPVAWSGTRPLADPADQDFWLASSVDGSLEWDVTNGEWAIVALNADGSPGVDLAVTGSAKVPYLQAFGIAALVLGVASMGGGATLTYLGVRRVPAAATPTPEPLPAP